MVVRHQTLKDRTKEIDSEHGECGVDGTQQLKSMRINESD